MPPQCRRAALKFTQIHGGTLKVGDILSGGLEDVCAAARGGDCCRNDRYRERLGALGESWQLRLWSTSGKKEDEGRKQKSATHQEHCGMETVKNHALSVVLGRKTISWQHQTRTPRDPRA